MWKSIATALIACASGCLTAAFGASIDPQANPPVVHHPRNNAEGGDRGVRIAQTAREQRATNVPQIFYNIVTEGKAACNGDVTTVTRSISIGRGTRVLSVSEDTFASRDVGKAIGVPGAGSSGGKLLARIASFTNAQSVVLDRGAATGLSGTSKDITYGTDDAPKFMAFNKWALANQGTKQVVLSIPKGAKCWFGSTVWSTRVNLGNAWAAGINNLLVEGAEATINSVGGASFWLGGRGICQAGLAAANGCSARIETVQAGAKRIILTPSSLSAGYISRFTVGKWLMLGGLDTQGLWNSPYGFPPNQTIFEWRQVIAVDTTTGVITLDRSLSDTYLSTWPNYNQGNNFEADNGGPATIWALHDTWNVTLEYSGLTINQEQQTYSPARNVTYRGVTFGGGHGGIPTQNETWSAINTSFVNVNLEVDKLIGTMTLDGVTIRQIVNQSTSTKRLIIRNTTITNRLDGGAQYTEITDSTLNNFGPGTLAYGNTGTANQTICSRCNIGTLNYSLGYTNSESPPFWTKSGGVIKMPNAAAQGAGPGQRFFIPGARVWYAGGTTNPPTSPLFACCDTLGSFEIGAITGDPWPALDDQMVSASVTSTNGSNIITVSGSSFTSGDIGKTIIIPGARNAGGAADLRTWITSVSGAGPQDLTVFSAATRTQTATTQTLQWGTSNTYIQTNQRGGFPNLSAFSAGSVQLKVMGSWNFTCDACTGDPNAVGASIQAGATPGAPLGAFISKSYTPTSAQGNLTIVPGRGVFKSLRINVTVAATSGGAVTLNPGGQFHWYMIDQNTFLAPAAFDWVPANLNINLKQVGDRVVTPRGITCNGVVGACNGDTINVPAHAATMWIQQGAMTPYMGSTFTGAPTFTVEMITDPLQ